MGTAVSAPDDEGLVLVDWDHDERLYEDVDRLRVLDHALVLPDLFGDTFSIFMPPGTTGIDNERIARVLATVAAHPGSTVYLPTAHVERASRWFDWFDSKDGGHAMPQHTVDKSTHRWFERRFRGETADMLIRWPLLNLVLCAAPADLGALLELPAARYGVWVRSEGDAGLVGDQYRNGWATDFTQQVSAILLDGGDECETCCADPYWYEHSKASDTCPECANTGLAPWAARELVTAAKTAGVHVVRAGGVA